MNLHIIHACSLNERFKRSNELWFRIYKSPFWNSSTIWRKVHLTEQELYNAPNVELTEKGCWQSCLEWSMSGFEFMLEKCAKCKNSSRKIYSLACIFWMSKIREFFVTNKLHRGIERRSDPENSRKHNSPVKAHM